MARGRTPRRGTRRSARTRSSPRDQEEDGTEAYLRQAIAASARISAEGRPVKKRRVAGKLVLEPAAHDESEEPEPETKEELKREDSPVEAPIQQTAYTDNDDSDDSDFEDVDLTTGGVDAATHSPRATSPEAPPQELNIVLGTKDRHSTPAGSRRKGVTAKERQLRVEIHKMHVLCLMSHASIRNHWCNDSSIQATMRNVLSTKTIHYLVDDETQSQFQRAKGFKEGLEQALESFEQNFRISARGMARSFWAEHADEVSRVEVPDDIDLPMGKADFRKCATERSASRDIGAQLFCALLRGLGMDVRLICSLQPLPLTSAAKGTAPEARKIASTIPHRETRVGFGSDLDRASDSSANEAASPKPRVAPIASRFTPSRGRANTPSRGTASVPRPKSEIKKRRSPESRFPVYWVEALDPAYQRWTPIDPLVTKTIGKPAKLEPPASDPQNAMSYVIAFEEDGSARDVTKRYTKAYNAKTRKLRIESSKTGDKWWKQVMRLYRKSVTEPRDQIEDSQLANKEAAEEMPKNIQDFKDHPYYALKRHLRKNEVIHPERQIGKVFTGRILGNENNESEPVYRRKDVLVVRSSDSWYRLGREVKPEELPLKWSQPRASKSKIPEDPDAEAEEPAATPLFAAYQTIIYRPPPVVRGRIPKNRFGNLDIYAPSMIPPGGVHVSHPAARDAARVLGVDYADAVIGFEFRGRQGTAVVRGAVIAEQFADALVDVIHGFAYDKAADDAEKRSENALKMWRHFLSALRIRERIQGYAVEGEEDEHSENESKNTHDDDISIDEEPETMVADFLPDYETFLKNQPPIQVIHSAAAQPVSNNPSTKMDNAKQPSPEGNKQTTSQIEGTKEDNDMPVEVNIKSHDTNDNSGGGFIVEEEEDDPNASGGGFLVEEEDNDLDASGGGFLVGDEPTPSKAPRDLSDARDPVVAPIESAIAPDLKMAEAPPPSQSSTKVSVRSPQQDSDKGSLLSHDPEDEDADPEWLA